MIANIKTFKRGTEAQSKKKINILLTLCPLPLNICALIFKLCALCLCAFVPFFLVRHAKADIRFSKHNLTWDKNTVYQTTADQICVFCHTPHGGRKDSAPLWNRSLNRDGTYSMYSSPTLDSIMPAMPDGVSLACLSCHDGTVAIDALINRQGSMGYYPQNIDNAGLSAGYEFRGGPQLDRNTMPEDGRITNLTMDLSNDHPISMVYPVVNELINTVDPKFNDPGSDHMFDNGIKLFGSADKEAKVQCASCHNPHKTDYGTFLRVSNSSSSLCRTCHIK